MKKFTNSCFLLLFGSFFLQYCNAVPVSAVNNDISNSVEEESDDETAVLMDDDITTHGLERLSSAATCLVAGVEYTHGQQIYREDQCEFCLCLDGEMFCWWQDCPPTMEGPCKEQGPFSPCLNTPSQKSPIQHQTAKPTPNIQKPSGSSTSSSSTLTSTTSTTNTEHTASIQQNMSSTIVSLESMNSTEVFPEAASTTEEEATSYSSEIPKTSSTTEGKAEPPKHCVVMGREYNIGDKLPHDTGNCIECICGEGAKLSCSPHQCAPAGDEITDYRPPGPRQPIPDVF